MVAQKIERLFPGAIYYQLCLYQHQLLCTCRGVGTVLGFKNSLNSYELKMYLIFPFYKKDKY